MPLHWTYEDISPREGELKQGDIIYPSEELRQILELVHPHFCDSKYLGFLVVTHCCDLVRRGGSPCKADHISLAVVRDLETLIGTFLDKVCRKISEGVYVRESKAEAHDLISRILNQNEQSIGLFYLHPDVACGIAEEAVAVLRVTVSLRAKEHYEAIQRARRGRLGPEFRSKLGWLVGNLYSRVGTRDWADQDTGEEQLNARIGQFLSSNQYAWVEESCVSAARAKGISFEGLSREELVATLDKYKPEPLKDLIAAEARRQLEKLLVAFSKTIAGTISQAITDQIRLAGGSLSKREVSFFMEEQLSQVLTETPNGIALAVVQALSEEAKIDETARQVFVEQCHAIVKKAIEEQEQALPDKLSKRLSNSSVLARSRSS